MHAPPITVPHGGAAGAATICGVAFSAEEGGKHGAFIRAGQQADSENGGSKFRQGKAGILHRPRKRVAAEVVTVEFDQVEGV
jgi:hypothetical protein